MGGGLVQRPELTCLYVNTAGMGYGRYGVKLVEQLERSGIDVYDRMDGPGIEDDPRFTIGATPDMHKSKKTNIVAWVATPGHVRGYWQDQTKVLSTMWEATVLPEGMRERLHNFEVLCVPSEQNLELFSRFHPNVHKVPLGIDTHDWHYIKRQPPATEFRFLIGGSGPRKGTDLACKAFRKVFPDGSWRADQPVPKLIMKSPTPDPYDPYGPRITRVAGRLTAAAEISLYASAHCYLQPSRGEGFGLQPLQAIAQGIPTILTDAHGHADFAHLGYGLSTTYEKAAYFIHGDAGEWWLPDFDELCELMRFVYDEYPRAEAFARNAAREAGLRWGWEHTADAFLEAIGGTEALSTPYGGDGSWVPADLKVYRVRVKKQHKLEAAGRIMILEPGVDYWEPADIKRILFEAGFLDDECLAGIDHGLTEDQAERACVTRAENVYCPTCQQRLNSGVRKGDELYAELEQRASLTLPRVTVCSMFRNASSYVTRYFDQVNRLREFLDVRLVLAEGDSDDATYDLILPLLREGDHLFRIEHHGPVFGSIDTPLRWENIAFVMRELLSKVDDPGDAFLWVEGDLVWEPAMLAGLVVDLEEVPAVAPLLLANDHRRYYDVWGYRKDGTRFEGSPPYHAGLAATGLTPIDSCGSCFAARPDVFKELVGFWNGMWPVRPLGLHIDVDIEVTHP